MEHDIEWLQQCHAVYRMEGESTGADHEVKVAEAISVPVYTDFELMTGVLLNRPQKMKTALDKPEKKVKLES